VGGGEEEDISYPSQDERRKGKGGGLGEWRRDKKKRREEDQISYFSFKLKKEKKDLGTSSAHPEKKEGKKPKGDSKGGLFFFRSKERGDETALSGAGPGRKERRRMGFRLFPPLPAQNGRKGGKKASARKRRGRRKTYPLPGCRRKGEKGRMRPTNEMEEPLSHIHKKGGRKNNARKGGKEKGGSTTNFFLMLYWACPHHEKGKKRSQGNI